MFHARGVLGEISGCGIEHNSYLVSKQDLLSIYFLFHSLAKEDKLLEERETVKIQSTTILQSPTLTSRL